MDNKTLMTVIVVVLLGVIGYLVYQNHKAEEQTVGGAVNEVVEEVTDEIDDATTSN